MSTWSGIPKFNCTDCPASVLKNPYAIECKKARTANLETEGEE